MLTKESEKKRMAIFLTCARPPRQELKLKCEIQNHSNLKRE
jgi:hypothetical protein